MGFFEKNSKLIITIVILFAVVYYFYPGILEGMTPGCGSCAVQIDKFCGDGCGEMGYPYGCGESNVKPEHENFSSCYQRKQIYLNSCDPDEPTAHADVNLEKRFGKLYINITANLPYAKGGVFNTMWGSYHAFLVDTHNGKSINLGSLVRHGSRFYKLATELLGDYSEYDSIFIYQTVEDYSPKLKMKGSITGQNCSSL